MTRQLKDLLSWTVSERRGLFDEQQLEEFQRELTRIDLTITFCAAAGNITEVSI
jgi:hypothetical protein